MLQLDATKKYPMSLPDGMLVKNIVYLKNVLDHPRIEVGNYSYYHNLRELDNYAEALAPYLHPASTEKLLIGKFVQIAHGACFITSSANHDMRGFSTYPFQIFSMNEHTTESDLNDLYENTNPGKNTVIGNDVWIGMNAVIMPGVTIGDGAIIGAGAIVAKDIAPYTIAAGNPSKDIKQRFSSEIIEVLLDIKWWDWPIGTIEQNTSAIVGNDLNKLIELAHQHPDR